MFIQIVLSSVAHLKGACSTSNSVCVVMWNGADLILHADACISVPGVNICLEGILVPHVPFAADYLSLIPHPWSAGLSPAWPAAGPTHRSLYLFANWWPISAALLFLESNSKLAPLVSSQTEGCCFYVGWVQIRDEI